MSRITKAGAIQANVRAYRRYHEAQARLKERREEARRARHTLIEAIHCHGKDVLSEGDIAQIRTALRGFLKAQRRLARASFRDHELKGILLGGATSQ